MSALPGRTECRSVRGDLFARSSDYVLLLLQVSETILQIENAYCRIGVGRDAVGLLECGRYSWGVGLKHSCPLYNGSCGLYAAYH